MCLVDFNCALLRRPLRGYRLGKGGLFENARIGYNRPSIGTIYHISCLRLSRMSKIVSPLVQDFV